MAAQAAYQITPPEPFDFTKPAEWTKWVRRFERFREASGLAQKTEISQVNTFIYSMGDEADDILASFNLTEEEKGQFDTVKARFDSYFIVKHNVIFERAKFNQRKQESGETVNAFITALYGLSEFCSYGALHDEMIRDRIVVGLQDSKLSEALQLDPQLTLEKAVAKARQSEAVKQQQDVVRGGEISKAELNADYINSKAKYKSHTQGKPNAYQKKVQPRVEQPKPAYRNWTVKPKPENGKCPRCGKLPRHPQRDCPAHQATCIKCKKKGHFAAMCYSSTTVGGIHTEEDQIFLGEIKSSETTDNWAVGIIIENKNIEFKIDTGAEVTVISNEQFNTFKGVKLQEPLQKLFGPGRKELEVEGQFSTILTWKEKTTMQTVYVVHNLHRALLGKPAIEAFEMIARLDTVEKPELEFSKIFQGLGSLGEEHSYAIQLKEDAVPFALVTPRRVPIPLKTQVQKELMRMVELGVIKKVEDPTDWCSGMVVVPKANGSVRICVDLTKLNHSVKRERFILPTVEYTLAQLGGAKYFAKLDANSGFWQIHLNEESQLLTTFITPFGRFCFKRLPFGISSAPEVYQRIVEKILQGRAGVVCKMDDILVFGSTLEEHDRRLKEVMEHLRDAGVTLNREKCVFRKTRVEFLGQVIASEGVHPSSDKVAAIVKMPPPENISELRRFLGMTNHLGKFIPHLAEITKPLTDLLSTKNEWYWDAPQEEALERIKQELVSSATLALYDPTKKTKVTTDASLCGLGAVLSQQQQNGEWKPIAFASKTLTETQRRYSSIEKEGLAVIWGLEKFKDYIIGIKVHIETDHKPLVPIYTDKILDELTPRLQRFRMKLMRFDYSIEHVPGKQLLIADTLSRAPIPGRAGDTWDEEIQAYVDSVVYGLPASATKLEEIVTEQDNDPVCKELKELCQGEWTKRRKSTSCSQAYRACKEDFSVENNVLLKGNRIVIPPALQAEVLATIHVGHQGITKCKRLARESVWWLGMGKDIAEMVSKCRECAVIRSNRLEPMIVTEIPQRPWQKVATDLFELKGRMYLVVEDYFSRYPEVVLLTSTTSCAIINKLKAIFAIHGIPETLISDNGPQYASKLFEDFAKSYGFKHITSSPRHPQGNGLAETGVRILKNILKKAEDPYLALLVYRSTPLEQGFSPGELLMGRKLRNVVPVPEGALQPKWPDLDLFKKRDAEIKAKQKRYFDRRHGVHPLTILEKGSHVWIPDANQEGQVVHQTPHPRSYLVETPSGTLRRNRTQLIHLHGEARPGLQLLEEGEMHKTPEKENETVQEPDGPPQGNAVPSQSKMDFYRTRSGRVCSAPKRLDL